MLLFPEALAPMRIVNGPRDSMASWKFLNRFRCKDSITVRTPPRYQRLVGPFSSSLSSSSPKPGKATARHRRHAAHRQVVAEVFQDDPFVGSFAGQFYQGLEQLEEQRVLAKAAGTELFIDLDHIAELPEEHQAVDLVDERRGAAFFVVAHRLSFALVAGT